MAAAAAAFASAEEMVNVNLTSHYAEHWGIWEGLRELIQNWHDAALQGLSSLEENLVFDVHNEDCITAQSECGGPDLARIEYEHSTLTLINENATLSRRALLLGYSSKAVHRATIGHFGEGLKVGALALVRRGLDVVAWSDEQWDFELIDQEGVRVLMVRCTPTSNMRHRVIVRVRGLVDWLDIKRRFLFLSPQIETYATSAGSLLLDPARAGELYVRGVFVSKIQDMAAGVDLADCKLDRDRASTLRREDLEHLVTTIWLGAIRHHGDDLLERYYTLLESGRPCLDVKHASFYAESNQVKQVAELWFKRHGDAAMPVCSSDGSSLLAKLQAYRDSVDIVYAPDALTQILRSVPGLVRKPQGVLDELERKSHAVPQLIAFSSLTPQERQILHGTAAFVKEAVDGYDNILDRLDVREKDMTTDAATVSSSGLRFDIPRRSLQATHLPNCRGETECFCAQIALAYDIVEASNPTRGSRLRLAASRPTMIAVDAKCCQRACGRTCELRETALLGELCRLRKDLASAWAEKDEVELELVECRDQASRFEVERLNMSHRCLAEARTQAAREYQDQLATLKGELGHAKKRLIERARDVSDARRRADGAEER